MDILAAVPVKDLVNAKQRLVPVLGAEQRQALARAMLEDVLTVLREALPGRVFVVTTDALVMEVAASYGAECLVEHANRGHTEAIAFAQREALARGAERFLTIPGDVPCVTRAEIEAVCAAADEPVTLVPSLSGFGTNGAVLSPPDVMPLTFGEPSFDNHLRAARARGLATHVLPLPGLGLDVDGPADLALLLAHGGHTESGRLLAEFGIPDRLATAASRGA